MRVRDARICSCRGCLHSVLYTFVPRRCRRRRTAISIELNNNNPRRNKPTKRQRRIVVQTRAEEVDLLDQTVDIFQSKRGVRKERERRQSSKMQMARTSRPQRMVHQMERLRRNRARFSKRERIRTKPRLRITIERIVHKRRLRKECKSSMKTCYMHY